MEDQNQKFVFQHLETPAPSVPEKVSGSEKPREDAREELAELKDTVETQQEEAASHRLENAVKKTGGFDKLLDATGKLGALTEDLLRKFGLEPADLDHAGPKIEEGASEKPEDKKFDQTKEIFKQKGFPEYVRNASTDFGVPPWAILSILRQESGNFNANAESPFTSAKGMAQAVDRTWNAFLNASDNPYFKEKIWTDPNGKKRDSRFNPEAAIYFTAWYVKNLIREVDTKIRLKGDIEGYLPEWRLTNGTNITTEDMKNIGIAYHSGSEGYLRRRRFNETGRGGEKLFKFQKRERVEVNGKRWMSYEDEVTKYQTNVTQYSKQYAQQVS